jgi:hypothetical protein
MKENKLRLTAVLLGDRGVGKYKILQKLKAKISFPN